MKVQDPYKIIKHPLSTEKAIRLMESENKLVFIVERRTTKIDIKNALKEVFNANVVSINTFIDKTGNKKVYVKFADDTPAIDIATNLGLM